MHQFCRADGIGSYRFAQEYAFTPICYGPALDQIHQGISKKGRMYPQMPFPLKVAGQGVKEGIHGKRYTASVLDQGGQIRPHFFIYLVNLPALKIDWRFCGFDKVIKIINVNKGIAQGAGGLITDLSNHQRGLFHCLSGHIYCRPEAAVTRLVRRCYLDKGRIDPDGSGFD